MADKREQYYEITLTDAIAGYQTGDYTAKGLLHLYFKIRLKRSWTLKETQKEICEKLGISRAAFYSALSKLKAEGSINWSAPADTKFSITLNSSDSNESTFQDEPSTIVDAQSTISDSQSTISDNQSTIVDSLSLIVTGEKTQAKQSKGLKDPSSSSSDSFSDFNQTLSHKTRESFEKFCFKKIEESSFKIASPKSWLKKHYVEYWEEFSRKHPEAAGVETSSTTAQPVEFMTSEHLRQMYGADWKAAAAHFGIEIKE